MNIYANSLSAAEKLLPEALIGLAVAKENGFEDEQYVSFAPDINVDSFDILSGPISSNLHIGRKDTAIAIVPHENVSIGQCVESALNAISDELRDMSYSPSSPDKKPKK